jgi:formate dehydrogenase alpha subunit
LETIALIIDGKRINTAAENSILEAAQQHDINIPNLCYHPDLKPHGACRMCLVKDQKTGRLLASCVTPVAADMVIQTATPRIVKHRRNIARLMIAEHPESCIVCSKGNRCRLRQVAAQLGVGETDLYHMPNFKPLEQANPFIIRDLSKCILCGKCIRSDHELVAVGAIDYNLRGFHSRPATVHETGLENSNCTFCGTCVSICPTGALSAKNSRYVGNPDHEADSICGFCGVGCSLTMGTTSNRITEVNPSHLAGSVNGATLCVRGHFAHDFLNSTDRLTAPMIRKNSAPEEPERVPVTWEEALDRVADRLIEIKNTYGPQSIAFMGSSKCTNEENYLFQKLARVGVGTNNVDNGGYCSGQFITRVLAEKTDGGCRVSPLADLGSAETIVVLGADPNHSVPVVSYYLKRAARRGTPIIVVDPRRTELVSFAAMWLRPRLQTDLELVNALMAILHAQKHYDLTFIDAYTEGFSILHDSLTSLDLDHSSRATGIDKAQLEKAAAQLMGKRVAFVVGHGIFQQKNAMHTLGAIFNLSLLTGNLNTPGGRIYLLARENNQVGAMDMGALPDQLPGRQALADGDVRQYWEKEWNVKLSPDPGLNMVRMVKAAEQGTLKALYVMGENPLRSLPQPGRVKQALSRLELLIVQDILNTETARLAHVILPGAAFSEKQGAFTNLEGRIQPFDAVAGPPGIARADWEILDLLTARVKQTKRYGDLGEIRNEIRRNVPAYADWRATHSNWVRESRKMALFNPAGANGLIRFYPVVNSEDGVEDKDYPYRAIIGSLRYHLGSGTRTSASERIRAIDSNGCVEIAPEDGAALGIADGDAAKLTSAYGTLESIVRLKKEIRPGELFIPMAMNSNDVMNLIDLSDLTETKSGGWKTVHVKLEKI